MKTTCKKALSVILAMLMMLSLLSVGVFAEEKTGLFENSQYYYEGDYAIHYRVIPAQGEFKGRIMFIHGFLYSGTTWDGMAAEMSKAGYDCYLVDLPNYGYSTRENADTVTIPREDLVVNLMETVAPLDSWILAGHSMGGGVAMNIAYDHPELKAMMLYCPGEITMPGESILNPITTSDLFQKAFTGIFNFFTKSEIFVRLMLLMVTKDISYSFSYDTDILTAPLLVEGTPSGIFYSMAYAENTNMEEASQITVPTMLVWADSDNMINQNQVDNITAALSGAEVHTVEGSHIVIETDPSTLAALSIEFLK